MNTQISEKEKSGSRISGGVILVITGCFNLAYGTIGLVASKINAGHIDYFPSLVMGISGMVGFFFAFLGGFAALERKSFFLSSISAILAIVAEFSYLVGYGSLSPHGAILVGLMMTAPIIVFTFTGLVLILSERSTFARV